jgi:predicted extracellular nuclease
MATCCMRPGRAALWCLWALLVWPATGAARCPAATDTLHTLKALQPTQAPRTEVEVQGVVTASLLGRDALNGFYLQQKAAAAPVGVFVYLPQPRQAWQDLIQPGHRLHVRGRLERFKGNWQLGRVSAIESCGKSGLPSPAPLRWSDDAAALQDTLVTLAAPLTVTGNYELGRFGSLALADERLLAASDEPLLMLDDGSYRANPKPVPYLNAKGTRRVGSEVRALTGVLTRAFGEWRIHPTEPVRFADTNPRPGPPPAPKGVRVAFMNVENYFVTRGERGAGTAREQVRQRQALLPALQALEADVLALAELENRPQAVRDLLERLNAGQPAERHYRTLWPAPLGEDKIRVALFYRPSVRPLGEPWADKAPVHERPPLAAVFEGTDAEQRFAVAVAHLKSKGGCPEAGDIDRGQGCWNRRRAAQAEALGGFLRGLGTERVLLVGDLNAEPGEDPLRVLVRANLADVLAQQVEQNYTYVYRNVSERLDYAFASQALAITAAGVWHINADEPSLLSYDEQRPAGLAIYRSSDHDPIWVDLAR